MSLLLVYTLRTSGAIFGFDTMPCIDCKVFLVVEPWCEVQMTRRPENSRHSPMSRLPTVKVLPTWRGIEATTPPTVAA